MTPAYAGDVAILESGYSVDDLDWARQQFGTAHVELDPWGNLIVSPASYPHERAVAILHAQLLRQLDLPDGCVISNGLPWRIPGGSRYTNVPDLMVVADQTELIEGPHFAPPPLLVVEVASPSTRAIDRDRKLHDYALGGAAAYLLVDLPGLAPVPRPTADVHDFRNQLRSGSAMTGMITVTVGDTMVTIDLDRLLTQ